MPGKNYKLTYFSAAGLAEPIRFLILYSGQEFQEELFMREDWPKLKPQQPFGKVPTLEIDGKKAHQSKAICRYLARQSGLAGSNDWEGMQVDAMVDCVDDLRQVFFGFFMEQNEATKATKKETFLKETMPYYMNKFEAVAKENGGYLANGKLSWADFYFATQVSSLVNRLSPDADMAKYPTLKALCDKIYALPKIADFVSKRAPYAY